MERVICGTPIGVLSCARVKDAPPGPFGRFIVDEVSKMSLSEFLAIAMKAERWVLVGDPQQLPPDNNAEENGPTLDDVLDPALELVCSVGAILERAKPYWRASVHLLVVTQDPSRLANAIRPHLAPVDLDNAPSVNSWDETTRSGIVVCLPAEVAECCAALAEPGASDRTLAVHADGAGDGRGHTPNANLIKRMNGVVDLLVIC